MLCESKTEKVREVLLALLLGIAELLFLPSAAQAHRLEADFRILPNLQVQVESWFDLSGDAPQGARVEVTAVDGRPIAAGQLDERGLFRFQAERAERLYIVVKAGAGHQKSLTIEAADFGVVTHSADAGAVDPVEPFADRSSRIAIKDVLGGLGFLLALAAFVLSWRNAARLRRLERDRQSPS